MYVYIDNNYALQLHRHRAMARTMSIPTYEKILKHHGLDETQMQVECSEEVISAVAKKMTRWRSVNLGLGTGAKDSVENDRSGDEEGKRRLYLEKWRETFGHEATYKRLVERFIDGERVDLADVVCHTVLAEDVGESG